MEKNNPLKTNVKVESGFLVVEKNEKSFSFEMKKLSERLAKATDEQLAQFTVSPSGYGIHWYALDEDISIPALLNEPIVPYGKKE